MLLCERQNTMETGWKERKIKFVFRACAVSALRTSNASDIDLFIASREIRRSGCGVRVECAIGKVHNRRRGFPSISVSSSEAVARISSIFRNVTRDALFTVSLFFQELCQQTPKEIKEANKALLKSCRWSRASAKKRVIVEGWFQRKMKAIFFWTRGAFLSGKWGFDLGKAEKSSSTTTKKKRKENERTSGFFSQISMLDVCVERRAEKGNWKRNIQQHPIQANRF